MNKVYTDVHTCRNMHDLRKLKNIVHAMTEKEQIGFYPNRNWLNRTQAIAHLESRPFIAEFKSQIGMGHTVCLHVAWKGDD